MELTLKEAATVLGKSPRQIRYLIKAGRLPGKKQGSQWRIASDDLPLTDAQRASLADRLEAARAAFEKGVAPVARATAGDQGSRGKGKGKKSYSVNDLLVFQAGEAIYRELARDLGEDTPAARNLFNALAMVARGCHSYNSSDKASRFIEAREMAATTVVDLLLREAPDSPSRALAGRIEDEVIPKIAGLISSNEKRSKRGRFDRFGAGSRGRAS